MANNPTHNSIVATVTKAVVTDQQVTVTYQDGLTTQQVTGAVAGTYVTNDEFRFDVRPATGPARSFDLNTGGFAIQLAS